MNKEEIIEEFKHRYINSKNNNYIFSELNNFDILDNIPNQCFVTTYESINNINVAQNIKINLEEISVQGVLLFTLTKLESMGLLIERINDSFSFKNKFDLLKFQSILNRNNIMVQFIFYNIENLSLENQQLLNEIYCFHSLCFNANTFLKNKDFCSYFLNDGRVLDNRENYSKVKVIYYDETIQQQKKLQKINLGGRKWK